MRRLVLEVTAGPAEGTRLEPESERVTVGSAEGNDLVIDDPTVSRYHLELRRGRFGVVVTDLDSTNGTRHEGARLHEAEVPSGATLTIGDSALRVSDGGRMTLELHEDDELGALVGRTPAMRRLMALVRRAARRDVAVLLVGESGTGKELVARGLHAEGERARGPFVTVDCGALAPSLIASELFGHEKGAFTGAERQHLGAFERANGGTLFLDEIGELPPSLQPMLLGALERRAFRRVGGREEVSVDVRVVGATHRDLRAEVNAGRFRLDLYYRLAVVVLRLPALRERLEDLPLLVERFLREAGHEGPVEDVIGSEQMDAFAAHRWPGNVRELRNAVEATFAMGELVLGEGPLGADAGDAARWLEQGYKDARATVIFDFERRFLEELVERAEGNVSKAARLARMDRTYLIKLLQRHGLK